MHARLLQSCPALCDPMDCCLPGSSVHGILQARTLEWVAIPSSRRISWPRDQTCVFFVSCTGRQVPYQWCHDTWIESLKTPEKDNGTLAASCSCNAVVCRIVPSCPVTGNSNRSSLEMVIIIANHFCVSSCVWCWLFLLFSGQSFICYNYCHFRDKKTEPWRKVTHPGSNQQ